MRPDALLNIEVEQELLGTILINNAAMAEAAPHVDASDFGAPLHGELWTTITAMIDAGQPANAYTVKMAYEGRRDFEQLGGGLYLGKIAANSSSFVSVRAYAEMIRDLAGKRRIIAATSEIAVAARQIEGVSATDIAAEAMQKIEAAIGQRAASTQRTMAAVADDALARLERGWLGEETGIRTGLADLDAIFEGFEPGGLYIMAGRPGMGKTGVALAVAANVALAGRVLFHSLEMPEGQLFARLVAAQCGVPYNRIGRRRTPEQMNIIAEAGAAMRALPMLIDDRAEVSVAHLRASIRRAQMRGPLGLVVVDYLQILTPDGAYRGNKTAEITAISNALKATARQCAVPILALAQLSRQLEGRDDKRPLMSDLRESGAIEQDADAIFLLYRPEYYSRQKAEAEPENMEAQDAWKNDAHKLEIDVAKQRMGSPGRVTVWFDAATNRVRNWGG